MKYKLIPVEDLEKAEDARKRLYNALSGPAQKFLLPMLTDITGPIWKLANKKYEIIERPDNE